MIKTPLRKPRPAAPSRDPYRRRSWESDEDYKDRVQQLDSKSQEDLIKDQEALDAAAEWQAKYDSTAAQDAARSRKDFLDKKDKQAARLEKQFSSMRRATGLLNQAKDTANIDVSTAYRNQELLKSEEVKDKMHNINLMLKSLETACGVWGIAQSLPYMYMKYAPSLLGKLERTLIQKGATRFANQYVAPQLNRAVVMQNARGGDVMRWLEYAQDANLYSGAAIDAALIYTQSDMKDKLINGALLVPVAFDKVNNKYARLFSNLGGLAANIYDVHNNLTE